MRQMLVIGLDLGHPYPVRSLEDVAEPVGFGLVRAENPKVRGILVQADDIAEKGSKHAGRFSCCLTWAGYVDRIIMNVGHDEFALQASAIGMRIGAHAA